MVIPSVLAAMSQYVGRRFGYRVRRCVNGVGGRVSVKAIVVVDCHPD